MTSPLKLQLCSILSRRQRSPRRLTEYPIIRRLYRPFLLICVVSSLIALPAAQDGDDDNPQKVLIESNETWQSGVVLIYSTIILISLRLSSTVRHSPLSPVYPPILRLHLYATVMFVVGAISSLTVLLLSIFPVTRDVASDLMPCASPLLAIGGILALYPQTRAPEWDAQQITSLTGVPLWLAVFAALIFNGLTVAASLLNGAWAATSISIATTLVAIFGPRTPVVRNTLANGLVEPGGALIFKVGQHGEKAIIALCFSKYGKVIREFDGPSWTNLQSVDELGHDKNLRIGAYPVVSKVMVDEDKCSHLSLLSDPEQTNVRSVQLVSGLTSDVIGYIPLQNWLRKPFGDDVLGLQIYMDEFTMEMLGASIWSACFKDSAKDFPGAFEVYGRVVRKLLEPMPRPTHEALQLTPKDIDLSEDMAVTLDEFVRCILKVETITEDLLQPHQNIMRVILFAKLSKHFSVHAKEILAIAIDAVAGAISGDCKTDESELIRDIEELCVVFEGIDDGITEDNDIYAMVTDKAGRCLHWISRTDKLALKDCLNKRVYAVIMSDADHEVDLNVHVEAIRLSRKSNGRLEIYKTAIETQQTMKGTSQSIEDLNEAQWNESRLARPQRVWPGNWERTEPASAVATVKGMAEVASLQAITSGIAAGSVLFGRLLGA